jgi:hypothetical protein
MGGMKERSRMFWLSFHPFLTVSANRVTMAALWEGRPATIKKTGRRRPCGGFRLQSHSQNSE